MWPRILNIASGLWLMASPAALGYDGAAADNCHIVGPIVATFACIAIWEATRPLRWLNLPLGVWLAASPMVYDYPFAGAVNVVLLGIMIAILATLGGAVQQRFAGGWSSLWRQAGGDAM